MCGRAHGAATNESQTAILIIIVHKRSRIVAALLCAQAACGRLLMFLNLKRSRTLSLKNRLLRKELTAALTVVRCLIVGGVTKTTNKETMSGAKFTRTNNMHSQNIYVIVFAKYIAGNFGELYN